MLITNITKSPYQITVSGNRLYWTTLDVGGFSLMYLYDQSSLVSQLLSSSFVSTIGITALDEQKTQGNDGKREKGECKANDEGTHLWGGGGKKRGEIRELI